MKADEVKKIRKNAKLTQQEFADILGVSINTIQNWESGGVIPKTKIKLITSYSESITADNNIVSAPKDDYLKKRRDLKNTDTPHTLTYYKAANAAAGPAHNAEIFPVNKNEGVLHISDLFKGSQYAIRVSGNSMIPNYPPGVTIGIRQIEDKQISPGSTYVIEKGDDLWIKRLFYKEDDQDSGYFQCISDNNMLYDHGARKGQPYYPPFYIKIDEVRKLFKVTGMFKPNDLLVIS